MHDIKWIRDNPDAFDAALTRRGLSVEAKRLIEIDERRRAAIQASEAALARRNTASREIGAAKKSNEEARAQALMAEVTKLKDDIPKLEADAKAAGDELDKVLAEIPNLPLAEVPDGADETGNVEHHHFGARRNYAFTPKQHFELGEGLGQMDFETAAKLSGARFVVLNEPRAHGTRARAVHARCARPSTAMRKWRRRFGARRSDVPEPRNCQFGMTTGLGRVLTRSVYRLFHKMI
jgi:seryl-tRNA synthetase